MYPNLEKEMAKRKITRKQIAEVLGKQQTTVSLKLNGKNNLTLPECIAIRNVVDENMTIEYLFETRPA